MKMTHAMGDPSLWDSVSVDASGQATTGKAFIPPAMETFVHDDDGNLTSDARWDYEWDAENRLKVVRSRSGSPAPERRIEFAYDYLGRRVRQTVWNDRDDGQGTIVDNKDMLYVYDGWNLIAILNPQLQVKQTFVWGLDLSGTFQGAGGVGGLLAIDDTANGVHFVAYDGNGNVTALVPAVPAADGKPSAQYEYGPFGEVIRATGPMAKANPFRFSTKYQDEETDLLYYGFRYYSASMGRWISRDPIEEKGGENVYGFCANAPQSFTDRDGRDFGLWIGGGSGYTRWNPPSSPPPANPGIHQSVIDAANQEYGYAFGYYTDGANALTYSQVYGPDSPWTQAFQHEYQSHFDVARTDIRRMILDYCCRGKRDGILNSPQAADYSLNNLTPAENMRILIGDFAHFLGLSSGLKRTGSFRATYGIESIHCSSKCAKVKFVANDQFRFGSMTRIPLTNVSLRDNPNGSYRAPWNTVYLNWYWEETVCVKSEVQMRRLARSLILVIVLQVFGGCQKSAEPVGAPPPAIALLGRWSLENEPKFPSESRVAVPAPGQSTVVLSSNRFAMLTNVFVEERSLSPGIPPSGFTTSLKTEDASWDVGERQGAWSVILQIRNGQSVIMPIRQRANGELEITYRPDPEMAEPFVYVKAGM